MATITGVQVIDVRFPSVGILRRAEPGRAGRRAELLRDGFPAYATSIGWLGYDDAKLRRLCREALADGWTRFKMKVGANVEPAQEPAPGLNPGADSDSALQPTDPVGPSRATTPA